MRQIRFRLFAPALLALCLSLGSCARPLTTSGTFLSDAQLAQVTPGMPVAQVRELFGAPSYRSALNPNFLAYIGTRLQVRLFAQPEPVERRIFAFDASGGSVSDIVQITLADSQQISPSPERTPTNGRTIGLVEELLGNIRRFDDGG